MQGLFSFDVFKLSSLCSKYGSAFLPQPTPKYWLFQFSPEIYNWFGWIKEKEETEQWLTSRHFKEICKDDMVVIWSSGQKTGTAGIYAVGRVVEYPVKKPLNPDQEKHYLAKSEVEKFQKYPSVIVKHFKVFVEKPLLQEECKKDSVLSSMHVFSNPQGTNFRLTRKHWDRILEKIDHML